MAKHQDEFGLAEKLLKQYWEGVHDKRRDAAMLAGLDKHLDKETGLIEILGFNHVEKLANEFDNRMTVILTRRSHLNQHQIAWFDEPAKAKAH